jgi:hypothetical protein
MARMKKRLILTLSLTALGAGIHLTSHGQGAFTNLGFESPIPPLSGIMPAQQAIPGWSAHVPNGFIGYNTLTIGGSGLILHDRNSPFAQPLLHNYSLALINGDDESVAAVSQVGTIPVGTQSLRFLATSLTPVVSFGGTTLATQRVGGTARFHVLVADVSALAGQTGELRFSHTGMLDGISFSALPVPEPGAVLLLLCGAALLRVPVRSRLKREEKD